MVEKKNLKIDLSIVILAYNVKSLLFDCLNSIYQSKPKESVWQVIVVDNASSDGTLEAVKKNFPQATTIRSNENLGFARGNNLAIDKIKSDYILFLNPDTIIKGQAISGTLEFLKSRKKAGVATCKVLLPNGRIDYSCHRGFPSPWNSFCYFTGLARAFPSLKFFSGYTATYLDLDEIHKLDCISGTFFLVKKEAAQLVGWWDSDYFWNGEDVEFCFNLRKLGKEVYYYPREYIIHYKGSSSGLGKTGKLKVPKSTKIKAAKSGIKVMRIFYSKHYMKEAPWLYRQFVLIGIWWLEKVRLWKIQFE